MHYLTQYLPFKDHACTTFNPLYTDSEPCNSPPPPTKIKIYVSIMAMFSMVTIALPRNCL